MDLCWNMSLSHCSQMGAFFTALLCHTVQVFFSLHFCETDVFYSFYCRHDCGFYMFQFLQTWDGVRVAKFGVEHIGYIRKAMLYSWLTSRKCCLDLTSLLIFADKGCFIELLYPRFILFLTTAWFRFFMGKWAALLFLYVGCIAVYKCGLHCCREVGCIVILYVGCIAFIQVWAALR